MFVIDLKEMIKRISMVPKLWLLIMIAVLVKSQKMKTPPQITSVFREEYFSENDRTEFSCSASGNPKPEFQWMKYDVNNVPQLVRNSSVVTVTANNISFTGIQLDDYGKYQCYAQNSLGKAISTMLYLKRAAILQFGNKETITLDPANEYTYLKIDCKFKGPCQPSKSCKFEWKEGTGTATSIVESERIAVDREGALHFVFLKASDTTTYSSPIACGMSLESAKAFYKGGPIIMSVIPVQNPPEMPPIATYSADVAGMLKGQATLQCIFSGYPVPDITWYKPNSQDRITANAKYKFESYGRKLIIEFLEESDEGDYKCKANNQVSEAYATVFLNVTSKPIFVKDAPKSLVIPRGDNAVFTCRMRSLEGENPPSAPEWYRNGEKIPANQFGPGKAYKYQLSADKTELTVKNVTNPGDSCSFMCIAGNVIVDDNDELKRMETYGGATLTVIEPIEVVVLSERSIELDSPTPFSLAFRASADETVGLILNLEWTLTKSDNKSVTGNAALEKLPWVMFNGYDNLTVMPEQADADNDDDKVREVTGSYQVKIYHAYQTKFVTFTVFTNIEPKPVVVVQSAGFEDFWIIGVILGVIVLFIVVMFIVCTLYRNRGGEYLVDKKEVAAGHDPEKELKDSGFADLSRADGEKTPFDRISLSDDVKPLESDEDSMMGDYDDDTMQKFNEDGSFIGAYLDTKKGLLHG